MEKNRSYHLFPGDQFSVIAKDFLFEVREKSREKRKPQQEKEFFENIKNPPPLREPNHGKQEKTFELMEITGDIFESKDSIVQVLGQGIVYI